MSVAINRYQTEMQLTDREFNAIHGKAFFQQVVDSLANDCDTFVKFADIDAVYATPTPPQKPFSKLCIHWSDFALPHHISESTLLNVMAMKIANELRATVQEYSRNAPKQNLNPSVLQVAGITIIKMTNEIMVPYRIVNRKP